MKKNERSYSMYFPLTLLIGFFLCLSISGYDVDKQGFLSLAIVTAVIVLFLFVTKKSPNDLIDVFKKIDLCYGLPLLFLIAITFVGFWLTGRLLGFFVYHYLFENNFVYIQYQIFELVSYLLATRLCLTLFNTIKKDALEDAKWKNQQQSIPKIEKPKPVFMKTGYIDTAIQAVIISIITVLPNYGNSAFLGKLGTTNDSQIIGFLLLLITLVIILMLLLFARKKLTISENSN